MKLSLGYEDLAWEILEGADRTWLVHRLIEEARAPEEKARIAEALRQADLRQAVQAEQDMVRKMPLRPMSAEEREAAEAECGRWLALGAPDPLLPPGDDGAFAVEPLLWRTTALHEIAPWHAVPAPGATRILLDIPKLRDLGWVKPAFLPEHLPPEGKDQVQGMSYTYLLIDLHREFLQAFYVFTGGRFRPDWVQDARPRLAQRWQQLEPTTS